MKNIVILSFIIRLSCHQLPGQSTEAFSQAVAELSSSNVAIRNSPEGCDSFMCEMIKRADENYSTKKLSEIVLACSDHCTQSMSVSLALTDWLAENHLIYKDKSPSEVNRFRGFLIYSLRLFMPNDILYKYVKNELQFSNHVFNLAAAACTAQIFTSHGPELVPILNTYLQHSFQDQWVDITTPELNYPFIHPTKAWYEIIKTLPFYGPDAYPSVKILAEIVDRENQKTGGRDSILADMAQQTMYTIMVATPICCRKEMTNSEMPANNLKLIPKKARKKINPTHFNILDQFGNSLKFEDLYGKPFVLTFFYTRCTNPQKCISTVGRLAKLQTLTEEQKLDKRVGIYGMTYDSDFDSPTIVADYGEISGIRFSNGVRFLVPDDKAEQQFFKQINLRVNYGYGSVNNHGIQLFVFDKKGRIAGASDNDLWEVNAIFNSLKQLIEE